MASSVNEHTEAFVGAVKYWVHVLYERVVFHVECERPGESVKYHLRELLISA